MIVRFSQGAIATSSERRHNLGKIEAVRHNVAKTTGTRPRHRTGAGRGEDGFEVLSKMAGAFVRAVLVMVLIAMPSVLLPGTTADTKQMVSLVALFAGVLTFVEYSATYPSIVDFRDAAPYNRTRFILLFLIVFFLSVAARNLVNPSNVGALFEAMAYVSGDALDFPYSPVRLITLMLPDDAPRALEIALRSAAGAAYMLVLMVLTAFVAILRIYNWPGSNGAFNVWINLPTFDPTAGGDVVIRLERDARINLALGFVLPFVIPAVVKLGGVDFGTFTLASAQTLIWMVAAWAFLPATLIMRGIAMGRIAGMIRESRKRRADAGAGAFSAA